jgi:hypothetical protein
LVHSLFDFAGVALQPSNHGISASQSINTYHHATLHTKGRHFARRAV